MRIIVSGGGTGGHIYPALSIAEALRRRGAEVLFVGSEGGMEREIVPRAGWAFRGVSAAPLTGRLPLSYLVAGRNLLRGAREASALISDFRADAVVGTGGYAAASTVTAALMRRMPVVIHEQNAVPGRTNRCLGRIASRVAVTFPGTERYFPKGRTVLTGLPIRPDMTTADDGEGRRLFGLRPDSRVLLVHGGSQGAVALNRAVLGAVADLLKSGLEVVHLTGHRGYEEVLQTSGELVHQGYHPMPYTEDIRYAYACADLVLGRAGASTLAETTAWGLPMILVPYPWACSDHQTANAVAMADAGAAEWVRDRDLTPAEVVERVTRLMADDETRSRMAAASERVGRTSADERVADLVCDALGRPYVVGAPKSPAASPSRALPKR
ncbi:MAG TPA: undecaprenyldiphospho-muramoylpentapeptide beta-N-acetylglucosaminyltransferase [Armatimonadota bacterium]|jgi:UDP-N-acetylglucosamine--N-acetylmuramyl-(pentapeptide) pyrophosphoryl-undecaprenol N-acetylglucosamine transferase